MNQRYPYNAYFKQPEIRRAVCDLYCHDFDLYAMACQTTLHRLESFSSSTKTISTTTIDSARGVLQSHCHDEHQRVEEICGSARVKRS